VGPRDKSSEKSVENRRGDARPKKNKQTRERKRGEFTNCSYEKEAAYWKGKKCLRFCGEKCEDSEQPSLGRHKYRFSCRRGAEDFIGREIRRSGLSRKGLPEEVDVN